jgi:hypothetical protein
MLRLNSARVLVVGETVKEMTFFWKKEFFVRSGLNKSLFEQLLTEPS